MLNCKFEEAACCCQGFLPPFFFLGGRNKLRPDVVGRSAVNRIFVSLNLTSLGGLSLIKAVDLRSDNVRRFLQSLAEVKQMLFT